MAKQKKQKILLPIAAVAVIAVAAAAIAVPKLLKSGNETDTAAGTVAFQGDIVIPESEVGETATFYDYDADGTTVELFAVRASDGTVRLALNTCQVCNGSPYAYFVQKGDSFICQNCKNTFKRDSIGTVHGGCNPTPLTEEEYQVTDGNIIVPAELLEQYAPNFKNWKKF